MNIWPKLPWRSESLEGALLLNERTKTDTADTSLERSFAHNVSTELSQEKPHVETASTIRNACLGVLVLSYVIALTAIAASVYLYVLNANHEQFKNGRTWSIVTNIAPTSRTILDLVLTAIVTICTEAMGYIHTVSLRWALFQEHRLPYSSNLRLLSRARRSWPNSWLANLISAVALIFSYCGASQTLIHYGNSDYVDAVPISRPGALLNGPALLFLGLGLLVQAILSTFCLTDGHDRLLTWSSNPLMIAYTCIRNQPEIFRRQENRCLLSAYDTVRAIEAHPVQPQQHQPSMRLTDPGTRHVVRIVWCVTVVALLWGIVVVILLNTLPSEGYFVFDYFPSIDFMLKTTSNGLLILLAIIGAFQTFATMSLHAVELLVNRARDEQCWRQAYRLPAKPRGIFRGRTSNPMDYNSITAALTSWQSLGLYILKPLIHWLFGNGLASSTKSGVPNAYMNYRFLFPLAAAMIVLSTFATLLARYKPSGTMPSSWGHIQTLSNLIDDWGDDVTKKMYWGDKGENDDDTRHAGTASSLSQIDSIKLDAKYM